MVTRYVKFLDLASQHLAIRTELGAAIDDVLTHSSFIGGKWVQRFEQAWAEYVNAKHCIGVANGTDALEICLHALHSKLRSVIVPAFTAPPTIGAVVSAGARPVFTDCGMDGLMDVSDLVQSSHTGRLVAVIPVHLYGNACNMSEILSFTVTLGAQVIEDCAQAHGTRFNGQHVGTFGIAGAFSFYPSKNLGAFGDAGCIVTNDDSIAAFCRSYSHHGRSPDDKNINTISGRNSRLDAIQAAILYVKLQHLDEWLAKRREVAAMYRDHLSTIVAHPWSWAHVQHSYHIYAIRVQRRDELKAFLEERGVETMVHYSPCIPDQPAYQLYATSGELYARTLADTTLSLPMGPHVTEEDVKYVAQCIEEFYNA